MKNLSKKIGYALGITLNFILLIPSLASAEQKEVFDGYEVHYNAFNSTFLTPEIAQTYGIVRSKAIGVLNISVLKTNESTKKNLELPEAVSAQVQGLVTNNIQQQRHLSFQRVIEGKAIYYIAEFQFGNNELLVFDISTQPQGESKPLKLRFSQNFFNE